MGQKNSKRKSKRDNKGKDRPLSPEHEMNERDKGQSPKKWYLLLAVTMLVTMLSYSNSLRNQFVFDDIPLISENSAIRGVKKIPRLLGVGKKRVSYRPIRMVSYAVDYTLNEKIWRYVNEYEGNKKGLNPLGYHISNCVYHLVTSFLVFLVAFSLSANYRVAFLTASLFALHPVHTDSVTYLSGRRDILVTLFYLAGFYFFLRYRKTKKFTLIIATFLAYLLSLGSKEMAVTLPAIFLCYDLVNNFPDKVKKINLTYFKELGLTFKRIIVQSRYLYSLTFLGALAFSYYKVFVKSPSHDMSYYGGSIFATFLTVGKILVHYINLLVYPIRLNADYSYNSFSLSSSFFEPATLFSFIVLGIAGYGILRLLMYHKMLAFGVIWFFVTLLPVCHIFPHHELLAEHYLYLPSFGFCLIGAILINDFLDEKRYVYITYTSFVVVLLLFSLRIVDRNMDWRNGYTLWSKTVETVPQCARALDNLGLAYVAKGMLDEAVTEHEKSIAINPRNAGANNNLGRAYAKKGRLDEAISQYKKALAIKPRYAEAHYNLGVAYAKKGSLDKAIYEYKLVLAIRSRYVEAHTNLGAAYAAKGRLDEAISAYRRALGINNSFVKAYNNLGIVYYKMGKLDDAVTMYEHALSIKPDYVKALSNLGFAYAKQGRLNDAIVTFKKALAINPGLEKAYNKLAWIYATSTDANIRDGNEAVLMATRACKLTGFKKAETLNTLAAAYAEQGSFDKAVNYQHKAIELSSQQKKEELQRRLLLYKSGHTYKNR